MQLVINLKTFQKIKLLSGKKFAVVSYERNCVNFVDEKFLLELLANQIEMKNFQELWKIQQRIRNNDLWDKTSSLIVSNFVDYD